MYMDALESEVEALSAEVTRLRLMLHRVTQVMELPAPSFQSGLAGTNSYADPLSASLGAAARSPPPPTLAALEQVLRAYPVELLEVLAMQKDKRRKTNERSKRNPKSRSRKSRKSRETSSSSSASESSNETDGLGSRSPSDTAASSHSDVGRRPKGKAGRRKKPSGTKTVRLCCNEGTVLQKEAVQPHGKQGALGAQSDNRTTPEADLGIPTALRNARRLTVAKVPSEASHSIREVSLSQVAKNSKTDVTTNNDEPISHEKGTSQRPVATSLATHHTQQRSDGDGSSKTIDRHSSLGDNILNAIRKQEEENDRDISDSSSGFLPPQGSHSLPSTGTGPMAVKDKKAPRRSSKSAAVESTHPKASRDETTEAEMSCVSLSVINEMLRFSSTSPRDQCLGTAGVGVTAAANSGASHVQAPGKMQVSTGDGAADNSYYNYSAFNTSLERRDAPDNDPGLREGEKDETHVKVLPRNSDNSSIDRQHGRSHAYRNSARQSAVLTPPQESHVHTPSEAKYSFSAFGSVAPSGLSFGGVPASDDEPRAGDSRSGLNSKAWQQSRSLQSKAMRPPSSEASTTEDASGLLRNKGSALTPQSLLYDRVTNDSGDVVLGARKPFPVVATPTPLRADAVKPTEALSPSSQIGASTPSATAGVRTPRAKRTVLQRLREEAEDSSDDSDDTREEERLAKTTKQTPVPALQTPVAHSSVSQSVHRYDKSSHSTGSGSGLESCSGQPSRPLAEDGGPLYSASQLLSHPSPAGEAQRSHVGQPTSSARQPVHLTPVNQSMSYTGIDAYSLDIYSPQFSPQQSPGVGEMGAAASQAKGDPSRLHPRDPLAASLSMSAANDYGIDYHSRAGTPRQQWSHGSARSPLSWMRSRSDRQGHSVDTNHLMAEGGYNYEF